MKRSSFIKNRYFLNERERQTDIQANITRQAERNINRGRTHTHTHTHTHIHTHTSRQTQLWGKEAQKVRGGRLAGEADRHKERQTNAEKVREVDRNRFIKSSKTDREAATLFEVRHVHLRRQTTSAAGTNGVDARAEKRESSQSI